MRALTPADDNLHTPTSDDMFWTETAWFACSVPERKLTLFTYPVFRANQNICSSGVYVWDDTAQANHEILYSHNFWHLPMPTDLTCMRLPSGLSYDVLEPLQKYRVRYASDDVNFDLIYAGLIPPQLSQREDHLDQPCRVTGEIDLFGEKIAVDGYEIRDKSWHIRSDHPLKVADDIANGSYTYAIAGNTCFLARTVGSNKNSTRVFGGWLVRDGVVSALVSGMRTVARVKGGLGNRVELDAVDALGRSLQVVGHTVNRFAVQSTPAITAWISGMTWDVGGQTIWGEDQEWSAGSDRKARRYD